VKRGFVVLGASVVGLSLLYACAGAEQSEATTADASSVDTATLVAALSVNGDGSDETFAGETDQPLVARGCGFETILETVVERYDADDSGDLDADERTALGAEFGDAESGTPAEHPNRGRPGRAALLLLSYDADGSGTLDAAEIDALKADIQARCEARLAKLVEEFDANADGTLDESEWDAARAALRERVAERWHARIAEFDTNGDGTLDAEERAALRERVLERRADAASEFDADGDGELSEDEQDQLGEHVRACVRDDVSMGSGDSGPGRRGRLDRGHGEHDGQADETDEAASDDGSSATDDTATDDTATDDTATDDTAADESSEDGAAQ
jgi:EF hand domain-containing protein